MPDPTTSKLPKPKSWQEFEDIVWNIYRRKWNDPHTQKYGRPGQAQQGVDICGIPENKGGVTYGIQCKNYRKLGLNTIKKEIKNAETFKPILACLIIATTDETDAKLQEQIRLNNEARKKAVPPEKQFPVHIVFWEDICNDLTDPANSDLLTKFYSGWQRVFGKPTGLDQDEKVVCNQILFDEAHGQGEWSGFTPTIQKDFQALTEILPEDYQVDFVAEGVQIDAKILARCKVLIVSIAPGRKLGGPPTPNLTGNEITAIHNFVRQGGGLIVLSTYTGDWHHEANLNQLIEPYGLAFNRDVILPEGSTEQDAIAQVRQRSPQAKMYVVEARPYIPEGASESNRDLAGLLNGIQKVLTLSSCSIYVDKGYVDKKLTSPLLVSHAQDVSFEPIPRGVGVWIDGWIPRGQGAYPLVAVSKIGKVVVAGGWKMFTDSFIQDQRYQNKELFLNILDWCSGS